MAQTDSRRQMYQNRLNAIGSEILSIGVQLNGIEGRIDGLEDRLNRLPARISRLRNMNYRILTHLERDQALLSEKWADVGTELREMVHSNAATLRSELNSAEAELSQRRLDPSNDVTKLTGLDAKVSGLRGRVSSLGGRVSGVLGDMEDTLQALEQDLSIAEESAALASQASFQWKEGESVVLAVRAEEMDKDVEGVLTLTNQRFIFESEKEVVLKKTLFIATEKKKVREVVVERPIGMVDKITKGRVGILAGAGLFVEFKPGSGLKEMKLDVKGHEADLTVRFFNMISSGQVDQELSAVQGTPEVNTKREPLICPRCGAPYTDEIYRGQTSVQCKYCGTVMPIP